MSLRPVVLVIFGIVGLLAAGYLVLLPASGTLHGFHERSVDGPLFAIATAFVSICLLVMSRESRTTTE